MNEERETQWILNEIDRADRAHPVGSIDWRDHGRRIARDYVANYDLEELIDFLDHLSATEHLNPDGNVFSAAIYARSRMVVKWAIADLKKREDEIQAAKDKDLERMHSQPTFGAF